MTGPFDSTTAVDNFRKHYSPTDPADKPKFDQAVDQLWRIAKLGYAFIPPIDDNTPPLPKSVTTEIVRNISIRIPELSQRLISQTLNSSNHDTCEDTTSISSPQIRFSGTHELVITAHVFHRERSCGHFLGIPYQYLKGEADGDAAVRYKLNSSLTPEQDGEVAVKNLNVRTGFFYDIIAFFTGSVGIPLSLVMRASVRNTVESSINGAGALLKANSDGRFDALTSGVTNVQEYTDIVDLLDIPIFATLVTDPQRSGLQVGSEDSPILNVTQTATVNGVAGNRSYSARVAEIKSTKDLAFSEPERVVIKRGDSLWKLLLARKLDPRMFILLVNFNHLPKTGKTRAGQVVYIPRLWYVADRVIQQDRLILPGTSIIKTMRRHREDKKYVVKAKLLSGNPNLVYPYEDEDLFTSSSGCSPLVSAQPGHKHRRISPCALIKN